MSARGNGIGVPTWNGLKRTSGLKRRKKKAVGYSQAELRDTVWARDGRCAFVRFGGCSGPRDGAHIVPKQVIRRSRLDLAIGDVLMDERNAVPACRHHHNRYDANLIELPETPEGHEDFLAEHNFRFNGRYWRQAA